MKTSDEKLVNALYLLARDIHSNDGVANICIAEGAARIDELSTALLEVEKVLYLEDGQNLAAKILLKIL